MNAIDRVQTVHQNFSNSKKMSTRHNSHLPSKIEAMRLYSLRPPGNQIKPTDPGLERMFRIELKKDDMNAENLVAGDSILLECPDTKAGGVGLAFLSSDTSKTQGRPTLKIYDSLKKMFGLTMEDKCIISKFNGKVRRATKVVVSDVSAMDNPIQPEIAHALEYWVGSSLGMLEVIGYSDGIELIEV